MKKHIITEYEPKDIDPKDVFYANIAGFASILCMDLVSNAQKGRGLSDEDLVRRITATALNIASACNISLVPKENIPDVFREDKVPVNPFLGYDPYPPSNDPTYWSDEEKQG